MDTRLRLFVYRTISKYVSKGIRKKKVISIALVPIMRMSAKCIVSLNISEIVLNKMDALGNEGLS
jgi:hypothetical protein